MCDSLQMSICQPSYSNLAVCQIFYWWYRHSPQIGSHVSILIHIRNPLSLFLSTMRVKTTHNHPSWRFHDDSSMTVLLEQVRGRVTASHPSFFRKCAQNLVFFSHIPFHMVLSRNVQGLFSANLMTFLLGLGLPCRSSPLRKHTCPCPAHDLIITYAYLYYFANIIQMLLNKNPH